MKAKNSEKIIRGYLEFAGGLLISTALSMALLTGFIHTNGSEYKLMESKTQEYDKIYARQIALVDKVDSLYNYLVLMGSNDRLNQVVLQKVISTRKMELIEELQIMDSKDVLLYKKLASQINVFQNWAPATFCWRSPTMAEGPGAPPKSTRAKAG